MSNENHLFPSRFEVNASTVALAIEHAKRSTPELRCGACDIEKRDWEEVLGRMTGPQIYTAWCGPAEEPLYAAVTGNGPTSEVNALFFAHARDIVIALGEEWQRLKEIERAAEDLAVAMNVAGHDGRDRIERVAFETLRIRLRPSESNSEEVKP